METACKLRVLRTNRGGEFTSIEFGLYCANEGVARQLTAPYSPQQNGIIKRRNQTVVAKARCMMKAKHMPRKFWGEAVRTGVFILNRPPTKAVPDKTPYKAWHGRTPAVHYFKTFGCVVHIKEVKPHLKKLEDRSKLMVFLGYEPGTKGYRVYDPDANRVVITRDTIFDEAVSWPWGEPVEHGEASTDDSFTVYYEVASTVAPASRPPSVEAMSPTPSTQLATPPDTPSVEFMSLPNTTLDVDDD